MRLLSIFIIICFSIQTYAQIYRAEKAGKVYFVELKNDTAQIEIYGGLDRYFIEKSLDTSIVLNITHPNDFLKLEVKKGACGLEFRKNIQKRFKKIRLKPSCSKDRAVVRNQAYSDHQASLLQILQDSLSGPDTHIRLNIGPRLDSVSSQVSENEYRTRVDKIADSLKKVIDQFKCPIVGKYYQKMDSLSYLDTLDVYNLLSTSIYEYYYGKCLLSKIAKDKPEILVAYIDSKPSNQKRVLRAIRNHRDFKGIAKNVKKLKLSTKGKRKIVKQKTIRVISDISLGTAYVSIILVELGALTALGIWIF